MGAEATAGSSRGGAATQSFRPAKRGAATGGGGIGRAGDAMVGRGHEGPGQARTRPRGRVVVMGGGQVVPTCIRSLTAPSKVCGVETGGGGVGHGGPAAPGEASGSHSSARAARVGVAGLRGASTSMRARGLTGQRPFVQTRFGNPRISCCCVRRRSTRSADSPAPPDPPRPTRARASSVSSAGYVA